MPAVKDHKWTRKLAKRVVAPLLEEYDAACNQVHSRNGTWVTRTALPPRGRVPTPESLEQRDKRQGSSERERKRDVDREDLRG